MISIPDSVVHWLAGGERGVSSEAIVSHIWKLPVRQYPAASHPHDPDDLKRCLKLLEASPETKARFSEMRTLSPEWSRLVSHWDELRALFLNEALDLEWSNRAPASKTYEAMRACIEARPKFDKVIETATEKAMSPRQDLICLCSHPESKHDHTGSCRKCDCTHFEAP